MGGVVVAVIVGAIILRVLFVRRRAINEWLTSRTRAVKASLAAAAAIVTVTAVGAGAATWDYTQHANEFCTGCHVMNTAFQRFTNSDNKHSKLSCHACHQQSLYASARQLYLWVAERPEKIGMHAKVQNRVCQGCHVTGDTAVWQRIAATAGHRVHLESDSSVLKGLQCVNCHGVEVHRFKPANETCGQSNCHSLAQTTIVLGKMASQTVRHCTSCHAFTSDVPALATRDSARGTLVPGKPQCLGCHEMQKILTDFNEGKDPHGGKCGTCHNPHTQKTPGGAVTSCATAGCHANWRDEPFHAGPNHKNISEQCLTCHVPHQAKLDASDCQGCHATVRAKGKLRPPVRFDTTKALGRIDTTPKRPPPPLDDAVPGDVILDDVILDDAILDDAILDDAIDDTASPGDVDSTVRLSQAPQPAADSFPHARHAKLACIECHETGPGHGRLTFEPPRGCAICHHQAANQGRCATCHHEEKYGAPKHMTVTITVPGHQPKPRPVDFLHARHSSRPCLECHTTPVTLAPAPDKAQCKDCHTEHHALGRNCSACHSLADPKVEHKTLEGAHQRCDACHTATSIAKLTPTRNLCSVCHTAKKMNHYDERECSTCHFLAAPAVYRSKLITPPPT
jgi:hypothetical protein